MKLSCVWEHHGEDSLLYSAQYAGAFTRGQSRQEALKNAVRTPILSCLEG